MIQSYKKGQKFSELVHFRFVSEVGYGLIVVIDLILIYMSICKLNICVLAFRITCDIVSWWILIVNIK